MLVVASELVSDIEDEVPLLLEGAVQALQHSVESIGELLHLGGLTLGFDALGQIGGLDASGDGGHVLDGPEGTAGQPVGDGKGDEDGTTTHSDE